MILLTCPPLAKIPVHTIVCSPAMGATEVCHANPFQPGSLQLAITPA